jgi:hypothetical protein
MNETGMAEVMKQEDAHFMAPFVPLDLNKYVDSNLDMRLTEKTIIQTKLLSKCDHLLGRLSGVLCGAVLWNENIKKLHKLWNLE